MKDKLIELHNKLTETYTNLLAEGCEDPRILKEVREFLNDNYITSDNIDVNTTSSKPIELDLKGDMLKNYMISGR